MGCIPGMFEVSLEVLLNARTLLRCMDVAALAHKHWFRSGRSVYLLNILQKAELETPADAGCMETISARRTDCTNLFTDPEVCFLLVLIFVLFPSAW